MKEIYTLRVISQEMLTHDIASLWVEAPFAKKVRPGQFVSFYLDDPSRLLPRPISICDVRTAPDALRFVYRIVGGGTAVLAKLKAGDCVRAMGPLGNGFPAEAAAGKRLLLVGGGLGVPPMLGCAHMLGEKKGAPGKEDALPPEKLLAAIGYRHDRFLSEEIAEAASLYISTDDGSFGVHGTVADVMAQITEPYDVIFACGPKPMLRAVVKIAREKNVPCYVSMEERMACGVGACLACVCETKTDDPHYGTPYRRICKDGPVFDAEELKEFDPE